jgi:hypothetical protein
MKSSVDDLVDEARCLSAGIATRVTGSQARVAGEEGRQPEQDEGVPRQIPWSQQPGHARGISQPRRHARKQLAYIASRATTHAGSTRSRYGSYSYYSLYDDDDNKPVWPQWL